MPKLLSPAFGKRRETAHLRAKQLADNILKDEKRLEDTKKKALEAAIYCAKIDEETQRLLKKGGHVPEERPAPACPGFAMAAPGHLGQDDKEKWDKMVNEASEALLVALSRGFPGVATVLDPPPAEGLQQGRTKLRKDPEGLPVVARVVEPVGDQVAIDRAAAAKQANADGNFTRTREDMEEKAMDTKEPEFAFPGADEELATTQGLGPFCSRALRVQLALILTSSAIHSTFVLMYAAARQVMLTLISIALYV